MPPNRGGQAHRDLRQRGESHTKQEIQRLRETHHERDTLPDAHAARRDAIHMETEKQRARRSHRHFLKWLKTGLCRASDLKLRRLEMQGQIWLCSGGRVALSQSLPLNISTLNYDIYGW